MTRRDLARTFAAGVGAWLAARPAAAAAQQQKLSKAEADYQDTPKGDAACSECTLFQPPRACSVVAGDIDPRGWCKLFEAAPE